MISKNNKFLDFSLNNISEKILNLTEENKELIKDLLETKNKLINVLEKQSTKL